MLKSTNAGLAAVVGLALTMTFLNMLLFSIFLNFYFGLTIFVPKSSVIFVEISIGSCDFSLI